MREARILEPEAVKMRGASGAQWSVFVAVRLHADSDGLCYPSVTTLERLTGLNRRTVTRAIGWLVNAGIIARVKTPGRSNVYQLTTRGSLAPSEVTQLGAISSPTRGNSVPQLGAASPPKQEELEHPLNSGDLFEEFWKGYPLQRGLERARTAFAALVARGEDPQDLVKAATAYAVECRRDGREDRYVLRAHRFLDPGARRFAEYVDLYAPPTTECPACGGLGFVEDLERDVAYECRECHSRGVVEIASEPA